MKAINSDIEAVDMNFSWILEGELAGCARPVRQVELKFLFSKGIRALVRLSERKEGAFEKQEIENAGMEDCHEPVPDFMEPTQDQIDRVIRFISQCLEIKKPVAVSCGAGIGRTGTILSCYFVSKGLTANEAIIKVQRSGRKPYETEQQKRAIEEYAGRLNRLV